MSAYADSYHHLTGEGAPMVGGVRPSWCPRAMGEFAASAKRLDWTNLAVSRAVWAVSVVLHEIIAVTDVI